MFVDAASILNILERWFLNIAGRVAMLSWLLGCVQSALGCTISGLAQIASPLLRILR